MNLNIIIVGALLVLSVVVGYFVTGKNGLDNATHTKIVESINELRAMETELNLLTMKSRFGLEKNYDQLVEISQHLTRTFGDLKKNYLGKSVTSDEDIANALVDYESYLVIKSDVIEDFKLNNSILRNSVNYAPLAGEQIIALAEAEGMYTQAEFLRETNESLFKYLLYSDEDAKSDLRLKVSSLGGFLSSFTGEDRRLFEEYLDHIKVVVNIQSDTQNYMLRAIQIPNIDALTKLENAYNLHHSEVVSQITNKLIGYGVILFIAILFLLYRLRSRDSQSSGGEKASFAGMGLNSEQFDQIMNDLTGPMQKVFSNINNAELNVKKIEKLYQYMTNVSKLYQQSPSENREQISKYVRGAIGECAKLNEGDVLNETDRLLLDSYRDLEKISKLVKRLKDPSQSDDVQPNLSDTQKIKKSSDTRKQFRERATKNFGVE